ncbi:hypothetical protein [Actinomadura sp. SCN-SB]|uniref:hypothetical protein n=1 Tax=Actinomadura sp. SCN-SB TaxID=3373092 RepID=UPI003751BA6B
MSEDGKGRDEYTWLHASRDLALSTPLTLGAAGRVVYEIEQTAVHPYDALPRLIEIFADGYSVEERARAIRSLMEAS